MTEFRKFWSSLSLFFVFYSQPVQAVTLVHSNDVQGDIEPCGCRNNPQGGMVRKQNFIKKLTDPLILQLDAGDLFFSSLKLPGLLAEQAELQAEYLLKAMDMTHHDVVVPGEKDFALGLKVFEKLQKKTKIRFLAANLKRKNGKPFLESHVIFTEKDSQVRVAVIGLVGQSLPWPKELKVLPPLTLAKKEIAALKGKADYIVVVTHQGLDEDRKLAKQVPGIDVIIGGHSQSFIQTPIQIGNTQIFQSSFKNQYIGVIPLSRPLKSQQYRLVGLDAGYDSPVEAPSEMDGLVKDFKTAIAELNSRQEEAVAQSQKSSSGSPSNANKFQTFSQCASCHLKQFDFWRKTQHAQALETLVQKGQAKNKECLSCHTVGLGDPQGFSQVNALAEYFKQNSKSGPDKIDEDLEEKTPNAEPLSTEDLNQFLKSIHQAKNLKNSVKVSRSDSTERPILEVIHSLSRSWAPVQCENCHRPGGDHPFSGKYSKKVERTVCLSCHTAERAPEWYASGQPNLKLIDAKRSLVACPAGDLSPEATD